MQTITVPLSDKIIKQYQKERSVRQLKDPRHRVIFRYHTNRNSGSFLIRHYRNGQEIWRKIGSYPELKTGPLLQRLTELTLRLVADANDRVQVSGFSTVADVLTWYRDRMTASAQLSDSRIHTIKSVINCQLLPVLGPLPLSDVTAAVIDDQLMWPLQQQYSAAYLKSIFGVLKAAFKQAYRQQRIEQNPFAELMFRDFIQAKIQPKTPLLSVAQLPNAIARLPDELTPARVLPLLMLLHGTRLGETRNLRWDWIDWNESLLTIPAEYTKTRQAHRIPLTVVARSLLQAYQSEQTRKGIHSVWLFPGRKRGQSISQTHANDLFQAVSDRAWTSHDLRKIARTVWADLGVDYIVGEQLLNHRLKDLDATYIHSAMQQQKRTALNQYHDWLIQQGLSVPTETVTRLNKNSIQPNATADNA